MNTTQLHLLASDKLYLLAYIKRHGERVPRRELQDNILAEGRMNYFFLCQYISELVEAAFIEERGRDLLITQEGIDALEMFSDQINSDDAESLDADESAYSIYEEGTFRVYEKYQSGELVFRLQIKEESPFFADEEDPKTSVEAIIEGIKKAGS